MQLVVIFLMCQRIRIYPRSLSKLLPIDKIPDVHVTAHRDLLENDQTKHTL